MNFVEHLTNGPSKTGQKGRRLHTLYMYKKGSKYVPPAVLSFGMKNSLFPFHFINIYDF